MKVPIPSPCPNETYEWAMSEAMARARAEGVWHVVFGDLFLEDIRAYREKQLAGCGMTPVFPVWGKDTRQLAEEMLAGGLSAHISPAWTQGSWIAVSRAEDSTRSLLADLPEDVDPCGENGEFHTFAYEGPMFREKIPVEVGEIVERDGSCSRILLPRMQPLARGAATR